VRKALIVSTVAKFIGCFEINDIRLLQEAGFEVHCAFNVFDEPDERAEKKVAAIEGVICHRVGFQRSPFNFSLFTAKKQLRNLIKEEGFSLVHCHTPTGGVVARLAAKKFFKSGLRVIYTAHGFHFFKGNSPIKNLIFKAVEKHCAKFTDTLITINEEDFQAAKRFKLRKGGQVVKINGVGVDLTKFDINVDRDKKRAELGLQDSETAVIAVGELNENKNHLTLIRAMERLNDEKIKLFICGIGTLEASHKALADKLGLTDKVIFLGYRYDISELLLSCDIFAFPSFREGLSVSLMEAMACGLPVAASDIRGNRDLITSQGGYLIAPADAKGFAKAIGELASDKARQSSFGKFNRERVIDFSLQSVEKTMREIYSQII